MPIAANSTAIPANTPSNTERKRLGAIDSDLSCSKVLMSVSGWALLTSYTALRMACCSKAGSVAARTITAWKNVGLCSLLTYTPGLSLLSSRLLTFSSATTPTIEVGDLFMSLIHTCQLCGANSFDYLTQLQRHARELAAEPVVWMPWNYRQTLERAGI